ncbi:MAG: hypothetical protein ACYDGM_13300 [Vulcanimicrobiaceae bacterium]
MFTRFTCFFAAVVLALSAPATAGIRITIPGGTPVAIRMVDTISSGTASPGDTFEFKADDAVSVNGWIVIARGAEGRGEITSVDRAGGNGHAGKLGLKFDYIYAVDGEKILLSDVNKTDAGQKAKGKSSTATIAGYVLLGPVGLFAHNWVKGKNITLDSSKTFTTFIDNTVHVVATQRALQTDNGFAH